MNIALLLETIAASRPDAVAITDERSVRTYAALMAGARRTTSRLRDAAPSGPVVYLGANSVVMAELLFAAAYVGRAFFPMNFRVKTEELAGQLRAVDPALVVVSDRNAATLRAAVANAGVGPLVLSPDDVAPAVADGSGVEAPLDPSRPAVYLATSGTTSAPKIAVITHGNLFDYVTNTVEAASADPDEAVLISAPAYHIASVAQVLGNVFRGRRIVLLRQFDARHWLEVVQAERVTHAMVVPTMLSRILDVLEHEPSLMPTSLVALSYGGSKAPPGLVRRAVDILPRQVSLSNAFGLTETSSTVCVLGPDDHRQALDSDDPAVQARLDSVGRAVPGVEVAIVRPDGSPAQPGEPGEICIRSSHVTAGYLGQPASIDEHGWLHTADQGHLDDEGYLFIGRREDDVIIRGGENIDPGEIEAVLLRHPAVRDVAVVGLSDPEWGETVGALVVGDAETPISALQDWVRQQLASFKVPTTVRWTDELPRNDMGKLVRRRAGRELADATATR